MTTLEKTNNDFGTSGSHLGPRRESICEDHHHRRTWSERQRLFDSLTHVRAAATDQFDLRGTTHAA